MGGRRRGLSLSLCDVQQYFFGLATNIHRIRETRGFVFICSLRSHLLNVLTSFPLTGGCSGLDAFRFVFKQSAVLVSNIVLVLSLLFDDVMFCLPFCWCPCMAINVSVQYDGGFLPDIILLTQCYYHRGTRLNAMKRFCIFSY